jgi:hypothetical protein
LSPAPQAHRGRPNRWPVVSACNQALLTRLLWFLRLLALSNQGAIFTGEQGIRFIFSISGDISINTTTVVENIFILFFV